MISVVIVSREWVTSIRLVVFKSEVQTFREGPHHSDSGGLK